MKRRTKIQILIDTAYAWYNGQWSAFYSFASTKGVIHEEKHRLDLIDEVNGCLLSASERGDKKQVKLLQNLKNHFDANQFAYGKIVFLQGDESKEVFNLLNKKTEIAAVKYLLQWQQDYYTEVTSEMSKGSSDYWNEIKYKGQTYILTYRESLGYIGLECKLSQKEIAELKTRFGKVYTN
jgi:hypothetical protein